MKRVIYYLSFTLLGALLGFFIHMVVEIWYIKLLLQDYNKYGLGMTWNDWENVSAAGVPVLAIGLAFLGYMQGRKWWRILYVEKRYAKRWGAKLKQDF